MNSDTEKRTIIVYRVLAILLVLNFIGCDFGGDKDKHFDMLVAGNGKVVRLNTGTGEIDQVNTFTGEIEKLKTPEVEPEVDLSTISKPQWHNPKGIHVYLSNQVNSNSERNGGEPYITFFVTNNGNVNIKKIKVKVIVGVIPTEPWVFFENYLYNPTLQAVKYEIVEIDCKVTPYSRMLFSTCMYNLPEYTFRIFNDDGEYSHLAYDTKLLSVYGDINIEISKPNQNLLVKSEVFKDENILNFKTLKLDKNKKQFIPITSQESDDLLDKLAKQKKLVDKQDTKEKHQ